MKSELDIIRVWRCDKCERYEMDFEKDVLFCRSCGRLMYHTAYQEIDAKSTEDTKDGGFAEK